MNRTPRTVMLVLTTMLLAGCLGIVDDFVQEWEEQEQIQMNWIPPELDLGHRVRNSPVLDRYDSCSALENDLRDSLAEEMLVNLDQASYWHWYSWGWMGGMEDDMLMEMDGAPVADSANSAEQGMDSSAPPSSSGAERSGEYSETNNQEQGVDEADFLKTDGYHIYMINNGRLVILGVPEYGQVTMESNMTLEGSPMQMLVAGDKLVIISYVSYWNLEESDPLRSELMVMEGDYWNWRISNMVKFTVVDISNRSAPVIDREIYLEGSYQTARLVGQTVRSVSHAYMYIPNLNYYPVLPDDYWQMDHDDPARQDAWNDSVNETIASNLDIIYGLNLDDFSPKMYERNADGEITQLSTVSADCSEFSAAADSVGRGFTTIMTLNLFEDEINYELDHVSSAWVETYASQNMLVLAEPANDWWWYWRNDAFEEATNIHVFDISELGQTTYIASGRISGTVNDQFSLSEYNGVIRVATTEDVWGRWWLEDGEDWVGPTNNVYTLAPTECLIPEGCEGDDELLQLGHIGDIAPGERIWSSRFIGDKGYLVTFRNIDPLWTIDLSDPTDPHIMGELEVPGVSTYIHPLGEDHLLTIGMAGGEDGLGLDWGNTQISLFNVSNFSNPTLADAQQLSPVDETDENYWRWSWASSEATYEHKAFTYWGPEEKLAVPLSTWRYTYEERVIDGRTFTYSGYEYVSQLVLLNVDAANDSLSIHGTVDHSDFYNDDGLSRYWYSGDTSIRRSIFMGNESTGTFVYAFSSAGVTVTQVDNMSLSDSVELPGLEDNYPTYPEDDKDDVRADGGEDSSEAEESPDR